MTLAFFVAHMDAGSPSDSFSVAKKFSGQFFIALNTTTIRWWQALNPAIYLISILPAAAILVMAGNQHVWYEGLFIATFAVVLLQHAINLFNDVSDWKLGADTEKMDSWVRIHSEQTKPVLLHAVLSFIAGGILGLSVLIYADLLWILLIAAPLIILGYLYNAGERPLSYTWMGEWVTGICYGGVFGCLWFVAGLDVGLSVFLGVMSFAALATSLLLSHQPPQIDTDRIAGKHSFAVRYGKDRTEKTSLSLFILFLIFTGLGVSLNNVNAFFLTVFFILSLACIGYLLKSGVNPRRILLSASAMILAETFLYF